MHYIPKFTDPIDFCAHMPYYPLNVTRFNGLYYTCKKTTTPGITPDNEEYWVLTGPQCCMLPDSFDEVPGRLDELRREFDECKQHVDTTLESHADRLTDIEDHIEANSQAIGNLSRRVKACEDDHAATRAIAEGAADVAGEAMDMASSAKTDVMALQAKVDQMKTELKAYIDAQDNAVRALAQAADTLSKQNKSRLDVLDSAVASVQTAQTALSTTVSGHTTEITNLKNTVSSHTTSITGIQSYQNTQDTGIDTAYQLANRVKNWALTLNKTWPTKSNLELCQGVSTITSPSLTVRVYGPIVTFFFTGTIKSGFNTGSSISFHNPDDLNPGILTSSAEIISGESTWAGVITLSREIDTHVNAPVINLIIRVPYTGSVRACFTGILSGGIGVYS